MNWLIFGDLHINKEFREFKVNPYLDSNFMTVTDYWHEGLSSYIFFITERMKDKKLNVCFLGDITDFNSKNFRDYEVFYAIIDNILSLHPDWEIWINVANHDSSGSYDLTKAHINEIACYDCRINVVNKPRCFNYSGYDIIFLPYIKRETILLTLYELKKRCKSNRVYIFSHNNIYLVDSFKATPMIPWFRIQQLFHPKQVTLINGHLHKYVYQDDYYQVGSVNPTSFKEYMNASGCVLLDCTKHHIKPYKNTKLLFVSINNANYIDKVIELAEQARIYNSTIFIKCPESLFESIKLILSKYKEVVPCYVLD